MFKLVKSEVVPLSKPLAESWAKMPQWKGDRLLKKSRVELLATKLMNGHFHSTHWAQAIYFGTAYRVNGQHSSHMLANLSDADFPRGLFAHIDTFTCESEEDLAALFGQFDNPESVRCRGDVINAHGVVHPELAEVSRTTLNNCVSGLAVAITDCTTHGKIVDTDERARLVHNEIPFILFASQFAKCRFLQRAGVIGAMYWTWLRDAGDAQVFWDGVRDGTFDVGHPTRILQDFLRDNFANSGNAKTRTWPQRAFYVKSIHAWNAFRRNSRTNLKYNPTTPIPRAI